MNKPMITKLLTLLILCVSSSFLWTACSQKMDSSSENISSNEDNTMSMGKKRAIDTKEISYTSDDGINMNGFMAMPAAAKEGANLPGVLVVHEWWGHNDYARSRAMQLAEMGYAALAVDMYGDGTQAGHPEDAQKFAMSVMGNLESAQARFDEAYETLIETGIVNESKVAAIGYCFGGSVVLTMANLGKPLVGVVAFHGGLQLPAKPKADVTAEYLVLNGAADPFVKAEDISNFKAMMDEAELNYTFINYKNAVHAYTNPGADSLGKKFNLPLAYQAEADSASWAEMQRFLASIFSK
jgi:dienelactone hydrolase